MSQERPTERVLAVMAHPDDVDFGSAGTIASLVAAGAHVAYCIVTNGDAGGFDDTVDRGAIAGIRQREQRLAAAELGVTDVVFLGYPDGYLEVSIQLRVDIARQIRRVRPDVLITQTAVRNPQSIYASHPDHLATGEAAICAVYPDARNPYWTPSLLDEGFPPHAVGQIWISGSEQPTKTVDITDHFDRKIAALNCHESQIADPAGMEARVRAWNLANGRNGQLPEGRLAESFLVIDTP